MLNSTNSRRMMMRRWGEMRRRKEGTKKSINSEILFLFL
jgi:hypothetical protein